MADYPDWLMKHKKKGTYINYSKGKYYLYAAHSERVKGTKKVKRVCDGYLGRITEKDGLIPPKDKVSGDVEVLEYGLCITIFELAKDIYSGFKRSFKHNADIVFINVILKTIYGVSTEEIFKTSYLSILFPDIDINQSLTKNQSSALQRGLLMIEDILNKHFKVEKHLVLAHLRTLYKVKINGKFYTSKESKQLEYIKNKYNLKWREYNG